MGRLGGKGKVILMIAGIVFAVLVVTVVAQLAYLSATATAPKVGLVDGHLRPCPTTPNCVSSESSMPPWRIEPLRFEGAPQVAWDDLRAAIEALGGTVVEERDGFLWATFTSRVFRFVDDMEFHMEAELGVIQLRSASRVGRSDLGVNAKRVARLRGLFEQRQALGGERI